MRLANMEAISVLKDEKPDSKATSLNLPGDSALGVEGTSGHTFPGATLLMLPGGVGRKKRNRYIHSNEKTNT